MQLRNGVSYVRRELAGAVFQLCVVGGLILGLLHGLDHPPGPATPCRGGGKCVADGVMAGIAPILARSLAGAVLGALVGYMVSKLIKGGRGLARSAAAAGTGRWITARYAGPCERCRAGVAPGDRVRHDPNRRKVTCATCAR